MRNVVWRTDVCSSQVAGKCTTCQLMAFMIWQKLNEFCNTTWENWKVYFKYKSNSIKIVTDDEVLNVMHILWNMLEQVTFQVDAMSELFRTISTC